MINHIVMWKIGPSESASKGKNIQTAAKMLNELPFVISEIQKFEVGVNWCDEASAFDLVLYSVFDSQESMHTYKVHPDHQKVVEFMKSVVTERAVVDY
ncbi:MAG: Dabb family protein [Fibrobacterales bacterium]